MIGQAVQDRAGAEASLRRYERRRLRSAQLATRQAEPNMLFGRPSGGLTRQVREGMLHALLAAPTAPLLARAFAVKIKESSPCPGS